MSATVMESLPAEGNLLASQSLAASANIGAYYDASAVIESQVVVIETTGTAASTSGVSVSAYRVYATGTTTTGTTSANGTGLSASGTSVTVASVSGIHVGQQIVIENEIVTVSAITTLTLTISALKRAHANGVAVYIITQTPPVTYPVLAQNLTASNTTYSEEAVLWTGRWYVSATNLDASNVVTIAFTRCNVTS